jgi:O-antigen ligase
MSEPQQQQSVLARAAFWLAFGSAASILFSIAVSSILLALAIAVLLISGLPMRLPPIQLPLGLFLGLTVVSVALSQNPIEGRPQIRKFFVYLTLLVVFSTFRELRQVRWLVLTISVLCALSSTRALMQFLTMLQNCGQSYGCLVGERITGFMSHWMTFGGQMMIGLMLLTAFLFWAPEPRKPAWFWTLCGALMLAAIFAGGTRSIWLATFCAGSFLLWRWKSWAMLAAPVLVVIALLAAPPFLKQRFTSAWKPQGQLDSNEHRRVSWRTGLRMIQAHPVFGIGPEHVKSHFKEYVPEDVKQLPEGWYGHLHNIYLHYAAERGIPALLALLWWLGKMLFDFGKALVRAPAGRNEAKFVLHGAFATLLAILIGGVFEHNLGDSEVLILFLAVMSCGYLAREKLNDAERA